MNFDGEQIQRSLITGQWREQAGVPSQSVIALLGKQVLDGDFKEVLRSPLVRELLTLRSDIPKDLSLPIKSWFEFSVPSAGGDYKQELVRLLTAVACLHAFLQVNWTGPDLDIDPLSLLDLPAPAATSASKKGDDPLINEETLQQKAVAELACAGEPAYHLAQASFLFRLSQILLDREYEHLRSVAWWKVRAWMVHEQLLGEPVAVPRDVLELLGEPLAETYADEPDLVGLLWLERGLLEHYQTNDRAALEYFVRAARATGLQYELTGALGRRTKFQQTDLTQLVLLAESRERGRDEDIRKGEGNRNGNRGAGVNTGKDTATTALEVTSSLDELAKKLPETLALNDDTLLEQTEFTSSNPAAPGSRLSHLDPSKQPALHPIDQSILLSLCLNVRNTSPAHGLTTEQMAPYVGRVISHPENWSVHTVALLLRSRLEAHRTRTVERSTLQLQALVDQMPTADSALADRLRLLHALPLPSKWELERELALRFLSIGVVKSALAIFERLEMWEEAVRCWQAIEQRERALAVVRDLLEGRRAEAEAVLARGKASATGTRRAAFDAAREAKLWCLLGELEPERAREHFERAWKVSRETSGRAMRSLGGYYFERKEYAEAARCLRRAVAINPLLVRSWFILGCACVREEDWEGAREAFTRCVTIDDEDAESWNNLASVYLRMNYVPGRTETQNESPSHDENEGQPSLKVDQAAAIPFENKMLAFRALKQGLKFHYENWRMWMNYTIVSMNVGEFSETCRALGRVVEERAAKVGPESVDEDVLDRLVDAATRQPLDEPENNVHSSNEGQGLLRRVEDLFVRIILPRVSSPRIFRARARLLVSQGRLSEALEAYLEGYRSGTAGQMQAGETDLGRWRDGVREVEDICGVLVNYGPKVEGSKWKLQARSIVRTFMGRTRDFQDEPEWSRLMDLVDDIKQE
ncbi:TPR-like protein [Multifurca ochricompacta]|uniref:TPR-like protein n=1 Tax=Multifurca ochricompacta TaxID=376703 RepID=A0AAD4M419_9AGAM|nr:TPR-like protein [Multifurca ochricompacta]